MTPGGAGAPGAPPVAPSAPRFQGSTTFQHFTPHQGFYQPAGPLIRSASPGGTVAPPNAPAPPTATVQPTVVTSQPSTKGTQPPSVREGEFSPSQKDPGSPVKPTPQPPPSAAPTGVPTGAPTAPAFQPGYPYGPHYAYAAAAAAAAGAPPPPFYPPAPPPPAPAPFYGAHPAAPHHPYTPQPFGFDPRGYPIYPSPFTPQYGSYYVAPALSYQPTSTATTAASTTSTPSVGSQVALPHPPPPGGYFYGGAYTYPYSAAAAAAGRFVAPTLLTLQPQPAAVPTVYPTYPHLQPQPGAPQQLTPDAAPASAPAAKNSQAGPQVVGKGSNSDNNNPEIIAEVQITPKPKLKNSSEVELKEKSSLRDYRKPTKPKQVTPAAPQVPNPTKSSSNAADYARALSGGEISITAVVGPKNPHPAPPKQQAPNVSMFPVQSLSKPASAAPPPSMMSKPPVLTPEIVLPRKPLPPTLTPEIVLPKKPVPPAALIAGNSVTKSNGVHNLPVLHIPEYTPFHKKKNRLPTVPLSSGSPGHPGMPNGLLQLSTSLQQKGSTKVTPKDQNARVALSKIGLIETSPITVSMAKSAASAVTVNRVSFHFEYHFEKKPQFCLIFQAKLLKPSPKNNKSKHMMKTSPESSRSSSRNSSVSPRERPSSSMKNRNGTNAEISPSNQAKKQPKKTNSKPLIPWCKRNIGPPKNCNGWSWVGEGSEQKVYLNVSLTFLRLMFPIFEFSRHFYPFRMKRLQWLEFAMLQ